jgi:hypothetical protein
MPGRSGVTAPIVPDSLTTGTTGVPRNRAGSHSMHLSTRPGHPPRSFVCSLIKIPRIDHFSSQDCHSFECNALCNASVARLQGAAESDMKIYLLMLLIGTLLAAIHFTSAPKQPSETLPQ